MHGKPGLNKRPHARLPFSFLDMNALMTSTEHSFESQATLVIYVLGLFFWQVIHRSMYNQAFADVRSTGAGIKCLFYSSINSSIGNICLIEPKRSVIELLPLFNQSRFIGISRFGFSHKGVLFITSWPNTASVCQRWEVLLMTSFQNVLVLQCTCQSTQLQIGYLA